jgi:hypothetical protein
MTTAWQDGQRERKDTAIPETPESAVRLFHVEQPEARFGRNVSRETSLIRPGKRS